MWWLSMTGLLAVSVLVYVGSAAHVLTFSPLNTQRAAADRAAAGEGERAQQRDASSASAGAAPSIRLRVTGGALGAQQIIVPILPDAQAPGTTGQPGGGQAAPEDRLYFRTPSGLTDVLSFYRQELAARGWHEVRTWMSRPATGASGIGGAISAFCWDVDRPTLLVGVLSFEDGSSEVRLIVDADQPGPCASTSPPGDQWTDLPPLF